MKLIVGLGNVGRQYEATRHNVGFVVVRQLAAQHRVALSQRCVAGRRLVALFGEGEVASTRVRLLLPQTMMNASGQALVAIRDWPVAPEDRLIVCDDVNLPLGAVRLRPQGGAGGHHGLASCLEALGTEQVARLRAGVGITPLPNDLTEFVITEFLDRERPVVNDVIAQAVSACELWVAQGIQATMNRINRDVAEG